MWGKLEGVVWRAARLHVGKGVEDAGCTCTVNKRGQVKKASEECENGKCKTKRLAERALREVQEALLEGVAKVGEARGHYMELHRVHMLGMESRVDEKGRRIRAPKGRKRKAVGGGEGGEEEVEEEELLAVMGTFRYQGEFTIKKYRQNAAQAAAPMGVKRAWLIGIEGTRERARPGNEKSEMGVVTTRALDPPLDQSRMELESRGEEGGGGGGTERGGVQERRGGRKRWGGEVWGTADHCRHAEAAKRRRRLLRAEGDMRGGKRAWGGDMPEGCRVVCADKRPRGFEAMMEEVGKKLAGEWEWVGEAPKPRERRQATALDRWVGGGGGGWERGERGRGGWWEG